MVTPPRDWVVSRGQEGRRQVGRGGGQGAQRKGPRVLPGADLCGSQGPARKKGAQRLGGLGPPGTEEARLSPWTRLCEHMVDPVPGEVTIGVSTSRSLNLRVDVTWHQG